MPDLIAQGPASENRWRREVPASASGNEVLIGRVGADWNVPWDSMISRGHVRLTPLSDDRVKIQCLESARNAVFYRGQKSTEFTLVPGDHFVIGHTTFTLANRPGASESSAANDVTEHEYDHSVLRRRHFRDAASRIEMLSRLPDLITSSGSDEELLVRVTGVLLQATPSASAVAIVAMEPCQLEEPKTDNPVRILHYDSRIPGSDEPSISARLVRSTIGKRESVLHLWSGYRSESLAFTASEDVDWAFCVPLRSESCPGWALYVTGQLIPDPGIDLGKSLQAAPDDLQDDVKFAELVGTTVANLRQSRRLERRQAAMRHFFAPVVLEALAGRDTDEVLEPREANLSVMFCDLRGFSRRSERDSAHLLELLAHVSDALGVMTRHILDTGGVIGDFHGDAAMGFWGWPLEQSDNAVRAATAAMRIRTTNHQQASADGFGVGIGIATGRAVAGRIGTIDQVKVTAFGPVVNLASRLEGVTKAFGSEVILDPATAQTLREIQSDQLRVRRLARIRPAGLDKSVDIYELLPAAQSDRRTLSQEQITEYELSLDALIRGDWDEAYERLHALPAWDRPKDALLATILRHNRVPPDTWKGVIDLPKL
ncbi:MAG: adenylate/guanylate cyclase domain-containing protein [Pirellulales bacterium]|nr:adenylate/guanylate cyclase domain-containing protein [Pirellulales bacterium]